MQWLLSTAIGLFGGKISQKNCNILKYFNINRYAGLILKFEWCCIHIIFFNFLIDAHITTITVTYYMHTQWHTTHTYIYMYAAACIYIYYICMHIYYIYMHISYEFLCNFEMLLHSFARLFPPPPNPAAVVYKRKANNVYRVTRHCKQMIQQQWACITNTTLKSDSISLELCIIIDIVKNTPLCFCSLDSTLATCQQKSNTCQPKSNTCQPKSNTCQPKSNTCQPKSNTCQPKSNTCQQKLNTCQAKSNHTSQPYLPHKHIYLTTILTSQPYITSQPYSLYNHIYFTTIFTSLPS